MFATQIYGTLLSAGLNYAVMTTIVTHQREILLDPEGNNIWSASNLQSLNSQAIIWALEEDLYSLKGRYAVVPLGLVIGLAFPVLHWALIKFVPTDEKVAAEHCNHHRIRGVQLLRQYLVGLVLDCSRRLLAVLAAASASRDLQQVQLPDRRCAGWWVSVCYLCPFLCGFGASGKSHPFPDWWGAPAAGNADHCL